MTGSQDSLEEPHGSMPMSFDAQSGPPPWLFFWGKARPEDVAVGPAWHPIAYHLLDVAAVADVLLRRRPRTAAIASKLLNLDADPTRELLVALTALHDLGKFGRAFQAKAPDLWPTGSFGPFDPSRAGTSLHTADGLALWGDHLAERVIDRWSPDTSDDSREGLDVLAHAVFGHHGRPARHDRAFAADRLMGRSGRVAAIECAAAILDAIPRPRLDQPLNTPRLRCASWWVAGFVTLCDWIGSRQAWFPYIAPDPQAGLHRYWIETLSRAEVATASAGVISPQAAPRRSLQKLLRMDIAPTPLQRWADEVALPQGSFLAIIEDVTGAGKTEAAQLLVHRLMVDRRASGAYWAMPTQATANSMYRRQEESLAALFANDATTRPSLVLAHGQSWLNDRFRATVMEYPAPRQSPSTGATGAGDGELPSELACPAFLADDGRASLLADVGAGTIDQALLGVLPSKFNTLRLLGLAEKVLIIDEAHAYDPYVTAELVELLRFQASLGGSAVILSATLLHKQRRTLVGAWRSGLADGRRVVVGDDISSMEYPLATTVSSQGALSQTPLAAAAWSERKLPVRFVRSTEAAVREIVDAARRGAAVAWVRNTVDSCVSASETLRAAGLRDVQVFHARFAQCDRQKREREVLACFGKEAASHARSGHVVVATQVIEQSLDLDFDLLVSDLAPADLLVQRAGRVWRHTWRAMPSRGVGAPELIVLAPSTDEVAGPGWLDDLLPKVRFVYPRLDVLWRTARRLESTPIISTPGALGEPSSVRALIEHAYSDDPVPDVLQSASDRADGAARAAGAIGTQVVLSLQDGYHGGAKGFVDEARAPTRMGDDRVTVRLARLRPDGDLDPWHEGEVSPRRAWALSELSLTRYRIPVGARVPSAFSDADARARTSWGRFEKEVPLVVLQQVPGAGDKFAGELRSADGRRSISFQYDALAGLGFT